MSICPVFPTSEFLPNLQYEYRKIDVAIAKEPVKRFAIRKKTSGGTKKGTSA